MAVGRVRCCSGWWTLITGHPIYRGVAVEGVGSTIYSRWTVLATRRPLDYGGKLILRFTASLWHRYGSLRHISYPGEHLSADWKYIVPFQGPVPFTGCFWHRDFHRHLSHESTVEITSRSLRKSRVTSKGKETGKVGRDGLERGWRIWDE